MTNVYYCQTIHSSQEDILASRSEHSVEVYSVTVCLYSYTLSPHPSLFLTTFPVPTVHVYMPSD